MTDRPRVLFLGGSLNQTTQMHRIAGELPDCDHAFSPYWCDGGLELLRRAGRLEFTILGERHRRRCLDYLDRHGLAVDLEGRRGGYDLVVTCSDLLVQKRLRGRRVVLVQEGILDPVEWPFRVWRRMRFLPRWIAGTATTGLSGAYDRFCVASPGYRDLFVANGAPAERVVVTGIPNFDDCAQYHANDFPHRGYVLVCSSDGRETFKRDDRRRFLGDCVRLAAGRPLVFKLHPNEDAVRSTREIRAVAPDALVFASGSAEAMIANCDVLVTQWSSTIFVGLALGKECHSYFDLAELRRLLPLQHGQAAARIAEVCRRVLAGEGRPEEVSPPPFPRLAGLGAAGPR
jgi:hypothetical protein